MSALSQSETPHIAILGSGGREHALAWRVAQDLADGRHEGSRLYAAPGNPGIRAVAECVKLDLSDNAAVVGFCREAKVGLAVVGPEQPLADGLADDLRKAGVAVVGPGRKAAALEGDKWFCKTLLRQAAVPTADAKLLNDEDAVDRHLAQLQSNAEREAGTVTTGAKAADVGVVVKNPNLALGKGVTVAKTLAEARAAAFEVLKQCRAEDKKPRVMIEERLEGVEASVLALVGGRDLFVFDPCQDHKQLGANDTGPMTGGMGAYCPTKIVDDRLLSTVERDVMIPTIEALAREDVPFHGVLYAGLMLTKRGPMVLEYNVRFGDPECQPLMMRLRGDFTGLLHAAATGTLADLADPPHFDQRPAVCVVLASGGYPGKYTRGKVITGLDAADGDPDVEIFHAGTALHGEHTVTAGGRVLGVTALGDDLAAARVKAYAVAEKIDFEGKTVREDIAARPEAG